MELVTLCTEKTLDYNLLNKTKTMKRTRTFLLPLAGLLMLAATGQAVGLAQLNVAAPAAPQVENTAFQVGEKLTYRVHYGLLTAGEAVFSVDPTVYTQNGLECYRLTCTARTSSAFEWFYKVRDEF